MLCCQWIAMFTTGKCETYHAKTIHIHTHGQRWLETEGGKSQGPSNPIQMNNWFRNGWTWGSSWLRGLSALHAFKGGVCFFWFSFIQWFFLQSDPHLAGNTRSVKHSSYWVFTKSTVVVPAGNIKILQSNTFLHASIIFRCLSKHSIQIVQK